MIPGSNILNQALSIIAAQSVSYTQFLSRELNALGLWVPTYATPKTARGSFQPIPRRLYQQYGLDLQKNYANFYTSNQVLDVARDVSCDQVQYQGRTYACLSVTPWYGIDGWVAVLCVEVTADEFSQLFSSRFNDVD